MDHKYTKLTDFDRVPISIYYMLAEGMCPNRCGPMKKTGPYECVCCMCDFQWHSKRIPRIFPTSPNMQ